MGGMSIWHWLVVLLIILLVFGTRKLGNVGSDLGRAIRDFKKGLNPDEDEPGADSAERRIGEEPGEGATRNDSRKEHASRDES